MSLVLFLRCVMFFYLCCDQIQYTYEKFITGICLLFFSLLFIGCSKDDESKSVREAEFDTSSAYVDCNLPFNQTVTRNAI